MIKSNIADLKKIEILEFINTVVSMRNSVHGFKSRIYTADENTNALEEQKNLSQIKETKSWKLQKRRKDR